MDGKIVFDKGEHGRRMRRRPSWSESSRMGQSLVKTTMKTMVGEGIYGVYLKVASDIL
jgi:hypothetical protein